MQTHNHRAEPPATSTDGAPPIPATDAPELPEADSAGRDPAGANAAAVLRELRGIRDLLAEQSAESLDAAAVARLLGISEPTLYRLRAAGKLPQARNLGGSATLVRWLRADVLAWLRAQRPAK